MKVLTVSDNPNLFTGLAKVHRNVIDGFVESGADVLPCAWYVHKSSAIAMAQASKEKLPKAYYESGGKQIEVYATNKGGQNALYAMFEAISALRPDVVVTLGDYWDFFYMQSIKRQLDYSFKWVPYLTIEEERIPDKWLPLFQYADAVATPSIFGAESLRKSGIEAQFIPYGTDECFSPCSPAKRLELREQRGLAPTDVRVISVGQNTSRKYLPMVLTIAKVLKSRADYNGGIKFYVHTNTTAMDQSEVYLYDLQELVCKFDVADMVSFPTKNSIFDGVPEGGLADEYNASDIFLSTSLSEGYNLPALEAMACGLPMVSSPMTTAFEHTGAKQTPITGDYAHSSIGPRGFLTACRTQVFPPDRVARMMDPYDAATILLAIAAGLGSGQAGGLKNISSECIKYAKERTWSAMKNDIVRLATGVPKSVTIPVEDI